MVEDRLLKQIEQMGRLIAQLMGRLNTTTDLVTETREQVNQAIRQYFGLSLTDWLALSDAQATKAVQSQAAIHEKNCDAWAELHFRLAQTSATDEELEPLLRRALLLWEIAEQFSGLYDWERLEKMRMVRDLLGN
jgi:Arc/MetJ family transcription regulator